MCNQHLKENMENRKVKCRKLLEINSLHMFVLKNSKLEKCIISILLQIILFLFIGQTNYYL